MTSSFRLEDFAAPSSSAPSSGKTSAVPRRLRGMLSLDDFEIAARRFLPASIFAYVSGGCEIDRSLRGNRSVFERLDWVTRILTATSHRTLATTQFG